MSDNSLRMDPSLRQKLAAMFAGNFLTQLIYVTGKLGIPDLLASDPMTASAIAAKSGANPLAMAAILRALVALEVLNVEEGDLYSLAPLGELLKSSPGWRSQAILLGEEYYQASGKLMHTAITGAPSFDQVFGMGFYDYLSGNQAAGAHFNEVMVMSAPIRYADVAQCFDFSRAGTLIDVGGGHGGLTSIILEANPNLRAILFDSPQVIAGAEPQIASRGLAARCACVGGNFFASVPSGGDAYLLSSVIVNWDDERALTILRNCRSAMSPAADLIMVDYGILPDSKYSAVTLVSAVAALAIQGSRMRTEVEYRTMLEQAGFKVEKISPLAYEPYILIHAKPK